jgi:hypothetical protein
MDAKCALETRLGAHVKITVFHLHRSGPESFIVAEPSCHSPCRRKRRDGMGDLRNKFRKLEETERIREMQRRLEAKGATPEPPQCKCGFTYYQVPTMWAHQADRWAPVKSIVQLACHHTWDSSPVKMIGWHSNCWKLWTEQQAQRL